MVFQGSDTTLEKRVKECEGSGIKLLMPEHPLTQKITSQLNCSRNVQMKPVSTNAAVFDVSIVHHINLKLQKMVCQLPHC